MSRRSTARLALAAWILITSAVAQNLAAPRTPPPPRILPADGLFGFSRLARSAGLIFAGRVTAVVHLPAAASNGIETVAVTFQVQQAIRGTSAGSRLTISQWKGAWSAGQTYRVGENVLLFLYPPGKLGLTSVVGGRLGRFSRSCRTHSAFSRAARGLSRRSPARRPIPGHFRRNAAGRAPDSRRRDGMTMTRDEMNRAKTRAIRWSRPIGVLFMCALLASLAYAGGPRYIAGTSYFETTATGQPLVWTAGQITYFTDQGDLSPILPNPAANSLVADAFSQWTSVPTAAIAATSGGQLAEDVTGANIAVGADGLVTGPADITPSATGTPVGIVYDFDGTVTDALLGSGAGDPTQCFYNAVFGGDDNYGVPATYLHALIVINGQCALESSQLVDVEYRLVRVIGSVMGLGWSQLNLNVITGNPPVTPADLAGFPVMHYADPPKCVPITNCYPNPYQLSPDDLAAISRLYPVTPANEPDFAGKQILSSTSGSIHGSVWFTDPAGSPTQPMQGVNVVARLLDPQTGLPSRAYAASSVSGYLFTGNAGNPVTGLFDTLGDPLSQWGSTEPALEGFFDLAGLPLPSGATAKYELTVEPVDADWSSGVGPYAPYLVDPSGSFPGITVTVHAGQDVEQDIRMQSPAQPLPPWSVSQSWTAPAPVPPAGNWSASLGSYSEVSYFLLSAKANRTLSVAVSALDETGNPSESKVQPVIAMWSASDPQGTPPPAFTTSPFNTVNFGETRLDAVIGDSAQFLIGIADLRGDGRPDYHYQAQVLYADSVAPTRISAGGGAVTVQGIGFSPGQDSSVGSNPAAPLAVNAGQMILGVPAASDGPETLTVTDPVTGSSTSISNALILGAGPTDTISLVNAVNPPTRS